MELRKLLPSSFFNMTSFAGAAIAGISITLIAFFFALELASGHSQAYMGIITFVILPAFFIGGLLVVAYGMHVEKKRRAKAGLEEGELPTVDFNNPAHRQKFAVLSGITFFVLLVSAFGSFQLFHFSESVQFCGEVCHEVMKPEYTAFLHSPHARVTCADCHIGAGADWFVQSKISGAYQVYSVAFNKFSRPIPTPVHNLRPARGTCEQCHWPQHFVGDKLVKKTYFMPDENNTPWSISLVMKTGGGNVQTGTSSGIHWHVNPANEVTYVSIDSQRQVIPIVYMKLEDGTYDEFVTTDSFDESKVPTGEKRTMDCIDCHNRPTHIYRTPEESINSLMSQGLVSPTLPSIRSIASAAFTAEYATEQEALRGIAASVKDRYANFYPDIAQTRAQDIDSAIVHLQKVFSRTIFPEMKVSWKHYPNNVGHYAYAGCFRCHDGKHVSKKTGNVISNDCNSCHVILSQGPDDKRASLSPKGEEFRHPVDIGESWKEMNCSDCHNGQ